MSAIRLLTLFHVLNQVHNEGEAASSPNLSVYLHSVGIWLWAEAELAGPDTGTTKLAIRSIRFGKLLLVHNHNDGYCGLW